MKSFIVFSAVAAVTIGSFAALAHAGTPSPKDRLTEMMTKLDGPQYRAMPGTPAARHWSLFNWLFQDAGDGTMPDDEVISTLDVPADPATPMPDVTPIDPKPLSGLAPNRVFRMQIGPGQSAKVQQHGAGNTATILQSN